MKFFIALALCLCLATADELQGRHHEQHSKTVEEAKRNLGIDANSFEEVGYYGGGYGTVSNAGVNSGLTATGSCGGCSSGDYTNAALQSVDFNSGASNALSSDWSSSANMGSEIAMSSGLAAGGSASSTLVEESESVQQPLALQTISGGLNGAEESVSHYQKQIVEQRPVHVIAAPSGGHESYVAYKKVTSSAAPAQIIVQPSVSSVVHESSRTTTGGGSSLGHLLSGGAYNGNSLASGSLTNLGATNLVGVHSYPSYGASLGSSSSLNSGVANRMSSSYSSDFGSSSRLQAGQSAGFGSSSQLQAGSGLSSGYGSTSQLQAGSGFGRSSQFQAGSGLSSGFGSSSQLQAGSGYHSGFGSNSHLQAASGLSSGYGSTSQLQAGSGLSSGLNYNQGLSNGYQVNSRFGAGTQYGSAASLGHIMTEAERLAKLQAQQISSGSVTAGSSQLNLDNSVGLGSGALTNLNSGAGSGYKTKSWEKASKWSSQSEFGSDGQVKNYKELSTGESENYDINGKRLGYKAATTTLDDNGKVSSYSLHS